ncbi:hypothetical protein [Nonomuraea sp. NPDC050691]|uniref:hypothetical protein n=1 Tax=Nonomuraea sp. NPDC050691 TaxID=3155661 RepID=UPI0033FD7016
MTAEDRLVVVDGLLGRPFPEEEEQEVPVKGVWEGHRSSGPGYHLCVLKASRDFWDDRSEDVVEAAEEEIDAALHAVSTALTARWGEPEVIDLWPFLESENPAPEPMSELCQLSGRMLAWRRPDAGRWVALAVGQADPEFPIQLLAAVGETPLP